MNRIIELRGIKKRYRQNEKSIEALCGVDFVLYENDFAAITGPSGSGKSTLMNIIGCLDKADEGEYLLCGKNIGKISKKENTFLRSRSIGFVFQAFHLLPKLTALENVELPMLYTNIPAKDRRKRAEELLRKVGLEDRMHHFPKELSGGQCQRIAIARALANNPPILLADEPTGNLDGNASKEVLDIFSELNSQGTSIIMITHDDYTASRAKKRYVLAEGRIC